MAFFSARKLSMLTNKRAWSKDCIQEFGGIILLILFRRFIEIIVATNMKAKTRKCYFKYISLVGIESL